MGDENMSHLFIPRTFHRIWLGDKPMPIDFINYGRTWCRKHPSWGIKLWTDKNMIPLQNQKAFDNAFHPVLKSDIAKLEILYNFGGVYIDCDFECLRNIEALITDRNFFAAYESYDMISTAIMGCSPKNPIIKTLIDGIPKALKFRKCRTINYRLGQAYATEKLVDRHDIKIFDSALFYPYLYDEKNKKNNKFPNAYAVHHWAGSWL
ncbi:glycosyltransferase [Clostridium sp. CX1]|uniref:glycosyltransferase family 32 protein n=1 Tax=Clostridium sp. CX1 TaxID=2978346 RepID=UPI0021C0CD57|nr:glycosyltransferase [Clostridium sp. CX1]MCT8977270.1 glycosyltransferase [Clostridium sp. CX1]